jgi:hypothetical protein
MDAAGFGDIVEPASTFYQGQWSSDVPCPYRSNNSILAVGRLERQFIPLSHLV